MLVAGSFYLYVPLSAILFGVAMYILREVQKSNAPVAPRPRTLNEALLQDPRRTPGERAGLLEALARSQSAEATTSTAATVPAPIRHYDYDINGERFEVRQPRTNGKWDGRPQDTLGS